jgi:hypothetical protein
MLKPTSFPFSVKENGSTGFVTTRRVCWAAALIERREEQAATIRNRRMVVCIREG